MGKRMRFLVAFLMVVGLLTTGAVPAAAVGNTLYVSNDLACGGLTPCYSTIQSAVSDAASGATVTVLGGSYTEQVVIAGKSLTLEGLDSPVINAPWYVRRTA